MSTLSAKLFYCQYPGCTSSYRRREHLSRHKAQHHGGRISAWRLLTARSDTLRRHVRHDHAGAELDSTRAAQACEGCRTAKVRCRGGPPCDQCRLRKRECIFNPSTSNALQSEAALSHDETAEQGEVDDIEVESDNASARSNDKIQHYVQLYFMHFHRHWPILHQHTFDIAHEPPFLVQAVIMVGLWVSGTESCREAAIELHSKLGCTIQEQRDGNEEGIPASRWPIATYQGILIYLLFSLISSQIPVGSLDLTLSLAASDRQILYALTETCLRNNIFYYPRMLERYLGVDDITCIWVGVEEIKRLGLALYKICRLCGRLLRLSDLQLPVPDSAHFWNAKSNAELSQLLYIDAEARVAKLDGSQETNWISNFGTLIEGKPNFIIFNRTSTMSSAKSFRQIIGVPPSTATTTDSTLIIIDAQNEYASGHLKVENVEQSRKVIADLLTRYRKTGSAKNIVHVVHQVPQGAPVFTPGTPLADEFAELTPKEGEKVITKNYPSSFAHTELHGYLQGLEDVGKKIVLVGYMAHVCISTTARVGAELGYDVLVVRDAVGDRHIPGVEAGQLVEVALNEVGDAFGTVVSAAEIQG
ncbi:Isochorismatase family-domain-containing protein [Aspergillus granulosus]|uniref:Isochorismatase family-domain-containing protein n=1 Tax=Aspergillus granulosus TaxID=176169 RepID=A0ABR4HEP2_9EURO